MSSTTKLPTPTKDTVYHAAMLLLGKNGTTNSLEVKKFLRDQKFWAEQDFISKSLQELAGQHGWKPFFNGRYNEYSLNTPAASPSTGSTPVSTTPFQDEILVFIEDHCGDEVSLNDSFASDLGLDDLDLVQVMTNIENNFDIKFAPGEQRNLKTPLDLSNRVQELLNIKNGVASTPVVVQAASPVQSAPISTTIKTRKKAAIINDSANPSTSPRVKINIDPSSHVLNGTLTSDVKSTYKASDWVVYHKTGSGSGVATDIKIYDEKYSSDHVRTAYARLVKIKIQATRACRVSKLK